MAAITICHDFGARKNKVWHCLHCFPIYVPWKWWDQMPWPLFSECWTLNQLFHSPLSLSSRDFLVTLHFLPYGWYNLCIWVTVLTPACTSSSLAFHMMYCACKLNKQGDNIQTSCTPFPVWNQSNVPCPVLTVASWLKYRFLKRQVRWSGIPISLRIFHSLLWSTQSKDLV